VTTQAEGETSINGGRIKSEISSWRDGAEASWIPGMVDEGALVSVVVVSSLLVRNTDYFPVPASHVHLRATDEQQWEVQFHRVQKAKRKVACLHYLLYESAISCDKGLVSRCGLLKYTDSAVRRESRYGWIYEVDIGRRKTVGGLRFEADALRSRPYPRATRLLLTQVKWLCWSCL
jgi:hypothetical protein